MVLSLMFIRVCATIALGGLAQLLALPCLATTAAELCPAGTGPCVVSSSTRVDDGSVIDTGSRHLLIASGGSLIVDEGTMTLRSERLTIQNGGALEAVGTGSEGGGTIDATANVIQVDGKIDAAGAPGGSVSLTSAGELSITGTIDVHSRTRDEDGGSIQLEGATVTLAGPIIANGGRDGFGGEIDVVSHGGLDISRNVEAFGGDSGALDLSAGEGGAGNLTISQGGRLEVDALADGGFADSISLEATGDGVATGHIIINGLLSAKGASDGNGGEITIDADGDVRGTDTTAHIIATGGRTTGQGGEVSVTTARGQYTCLAMIDVRGNSEAAGGSLTLDIGGAITLAVEIDARGGTRGGTIDATSDADLNVDGTLRTDGGPEGAARIALEGCTVVINPSAVLSSLGPSGTNRLLGHELSVVRGTMLATGEDGKNEIVFNGESGRPIVFDSAMVMPVVDEVEDPLLGPCANVGTPTQTPTPTRTTRPGTATPTPTRTPLPCAGDCDRGGSVTVNEIVLGVNIALERRQVSECPAFDTNSSGGVSIEELVRAVNNAVNGCPQ